MPRHTTGLALAAVAALLMMSCSDDDPAGDAQATATTEAPTTTTTTAAVPERRPTVEPAALEGPITAGTLSPPADPRPVDLAAIGYVEEEWFASGTAT